MKRHAPLLVCIFLVVSNLAVYWQVSGYDFVHFDDNEYVYENQHVITGLTPENVVWAFTAFHSNNWHPLTWLSHMADCQLFGLKPGRHHLTNLLFHVLNAVLLFFILFRMTGCLWKSAFVAALFALHPLHVESVAWISERKDVLSTFFWMLAILSYANYVRTRTLLTYIPVFLFFALGLMSKPMVVTLPFALLLLDFWPLDRLAGPPPDANRTRAIFGLVLEKAPLLLLIPVSSVLTFYAQKHGGVVKSLEIFPLHLRVENALVSYILYLVKIVFPTKLAFLYPHPSAFPVWETGGAFLFLIGVSLAAVLFSKRMPYCITGWFWFLGTLVPVIGIVQVGMQAMADRYTYIPSIGIFIIVAWGVPAIFGRVRPVKRLVPVAGSGLLLILSILTVHQLGFWRDTIRLFRHTIEVTSDNYIAHDSLGVEFFMQGRTDDAIFEYQKSLAIRPDYHYSHFNLGAAYYTKGKIDDAIREYEAAIHYEPRFVKAISNLGAAFFAKGRVEDAIREYRSAIDIDPGYVDAVFNLAIALDHLGRFDEAIRHYRKVLKRRPDFIMADFKAGVDCFRLGWFHVATDHFSKILAIKPEFWETHYYMGLAMYRLNRFQDAIEHYKKCIRIKPGAAEVYNNLGAAYLRAGNIDKASGCFKKAIEIKPDYQSAANNLKRISGNRMDGHE